MLDALVTADACGSLIVLSGVADISTIAQLTGMITAQLSQCTRCLMIDVSGLNFADSMSIWVLLLVARTLKTQGGSMVLIQPQPAVARMLTLVDTDQVITIRERTPHEPRCGPESGPPWHRQS
jgi:anti-anti-sigma factor